MKKLCMLFSFLFFQVSYGQGAIPSLTIQQSPLLIGAGSIGTAIPTNDALGFYFNPGLLGYNSNENHFSFLVMPAKTEFGRSNFNNYGLNIGYNLNRLKIPISVGVGFLRNSIDYGNVTVYDPQSKVNYNYNSGDSYNCFSLGIGYRHILEFNVGLSIKSYDSKLFGNFVNGNFTQYSATGTALDFGVMIITPVSQLFFPDVRYDVGSNWYLKPDVKFTLGYAAANIGKKVYYVDPAQSDPLSRTGRLGYTFDLGLDMLIYGTKFNSISYSFTAEAEDYLFKYYPTGGFEYQNLFGDISVGKNLIGLKADNEITLHKGHIFRFFDTFVITSGSETGPLNNNNKSSGLGITSDGIFKILSSNTHESIMKYLFTHLNFSYYQATQNYQTFGDVKFSGISVYFHNIEL